MIAGDMSSGVARVSAARADLEFADPCPISGC